MTLPRNQSLLDSSFDYTDSRQFALDEVKKIADDLGLDAGIVLQPYDDSDSRLIGFIVAYFYKKNAITLFSKSISLNDKLFYNDIHCRPISISDFKVSYSSYTQLVTYFVCESGEKMLLFETRGKDVLYSPGKNCLFTNSGDVASYINEATEAFELFPQLPEAVRGPLDILKFSFRNFYFVIFVLFGVSLLVMLLNLLQPVVTNYITSQAIPSLDKRVVYETIIPSLLVVIISFVLQYFQSLSTLRLESDVDIRLQTAVLERAFRLPIDFLLSFTPGDLNSRIQAISTLRQILGNQVVTTLISFVFSFIYFVMMFYLDSQLALVALGVSLFFILIMSFLIYRQSLYQWPLLQKQSDLTSFTFETANGIMQLRSCQAEPFVFRKWLQQINDISLLQRTSSFWANAASIVSSSVQPVGALFLFFAIVYNLIINPVSSSAAVGIVLVFIPFYSAYSAFNQNMLSVFSTLTNVAGQAVVNWNRAKPVIYANLEEGFGVEKVIREISGQLSFRDVAFRYPSSTEQLFKSITFDAPAGAFVAITGPSGCGKTTLMSLILGFNKPDVGNISLDSIPLPEYNIRDLRRQIGVVMQMSPLPAGTIYKIVCAGREFTESDVWEALDIASVADQIKLMPLGLDTVLNETSQTISGGQRQRIAIARAIIGRPKILLLDEATSALDNESQLNVTANLSRMSMTRLVIAHRLSTIKDADYVLDFGSATARFSKS